MIGHPSKIVSRESDRQGAPRRPINVCRLGFDQPDAVRGVGLCQLSAETGNRVGALGRKQLVAGNLFLTSELLADQFPRDSQGSARPLCQSLGTSQPGIGGAHGAGCRENGAVSL